MQCFDLVDTSRKKLVLVHSLVTPNPPSHDMGVYSVHIRETVTAASFLRIKKKLRWKQKRERIGDDCKQN